MTTTADPLSPALFTERRQRAFEMLAKTMVVRAGGG